MTPATVALLWIAGLVGGVANAIAGGATLITFPALLAAGLPPVVANASNAVGVIPGHLLAALADRRKLGLVDRRTIVPFVLVSLGSVTGALLLLDTPASIFALLVPALVGAATLIYALSPRLQPYLVQPSDHDQPNSKARFILLAGTAIYGGYFGAGLGVMLLAVLASTVREDIRTSNALKNLLATAASLAGVAVFTLKGAVRWQETSIVLLGAAIGGYVGGHLVKRLPAPAVRALVIIGGATMTILYGRSFWFP